MAQIGSPRPFTWQGSILQVLARGGYALSRFAKPARGGYTWQDWAHRLMTATGARRAQGPGTRHLFDYRSASGLDHELDSAAIGDVALVLEAKDHGHSVDKTQVDTFDGKTFDYFENAVHQGGGFPLYRMMWSTEAIAAKVHGYAARRGIIMVGLDRVPLPDLLAAAERWDATDWLPEAFLSEFVLLAERACQPLTAQASGQGPVFRSRLWSTQAIEDLGDLHELASERWLDWLDRVEPLHYEWHAATCLRLIAGWSELRPLSD